MVNQITRQSPEKLSLSMLHAWCSLISGEEQNIFVFHTKEELLLTARVGLLKVSNLSWVNLWMFDQFFF